MSDSMTCPMLTPLILNHHAEACRKALEPEFPELTIFATVDESEVGDFMEKADILLTLRPSDDIISKQKFWIMGPYPKI